eukprot:2254519-Prymnesium_polylepis.1
MAIWKTIALAAAILPVSLGAGAASCKDDNEHCVMWAKQGECSTNPTFMNEACRRACGQCTPVAEEEEPEPKPAKPTPDAPAPEKEEPAAAPEPASGLSLFRPRGPLKAVLWALAAVALSVAWVGWQHLQRARDAKRRGTASGAAGANDS